MGDPVDFATSRPPSRAEKARRAAKLRQRHRLAVENEKILEAAIGDALPHGPTRQAVIAKICAALSRQDLAIRKAPKE